LTIVTRAGRVHTMCMSFVLYAHAAENVHDRPIVFTNGGGLCAMGCARTNVRV
jgi:hypothetical protein